MHNKQTGGRSQRADGFTIIEILIVLAIAGLILLLVFLAVPALQRSSRNTVRKNDVQSVLGGISSFSAVNKGSLPRLVETLDDGLVHYSMPSGREATMEVQAASVTTKNERVPTSRTPVPELGELEVHIGYNCAGGVNQYMVAVVYSIETSASTPLWQCEET